MDKYFVNVVHTLADFLAVVDSRLVDADDKLEAQHLARNLVVRMVAL